MSRTTQLLILFFLVLYLAFPTANSTLDAFYYAGAVKHNTDLFLPHHLLYNATGFAFYKLLNFIGLRPDVLIFLKALNGIVAAACLVVLALLLKKIRIPSGLLFGWVLVAGASFGVWRFATENEVYILPVLFSLCGSFFWVRYFQVPKQGFLVLAGLFAAISCLYHQLHVFWWLGLLVAMVWYFRSFRLFLLFSLPALLVPLLYVLALVFDQQQSLTFQHLIEFVLHDFYNGSAGSSFGINNFLLTGISLIRTFIQVHGLMAYLPAKGWWWFLPAVVAGILFVRALLQKPFVRNQYLSEDQQIVGKIHLAILILHLLFAWYAVGNAEFMVMIPFLLPLLCRLPFSGNFLKNTGLALIIWNFWYGIFPLWYYKLSASTEWATKARSQPATLFILDDAQKVNNEYFYITGNAKGAPNIIKSPTLRALKNEDPGILHAEIDKCLRAGQPVLTDCIQKTKVITRSSMVTTDADAAFFDAYRVKPADSVVTFYGNQYLHRVLR